MTTNIDAEPTRAEIDALSSPVILEFGTSWCGYCFAAQPLITNVLHDHASLRHIKVEDGPGRPLGRSFKVKLWPTLVVVHEGKEVARVVRPTSTDTIAQAIAQLDSR
jgi:thioredoxin 1